MLRGLCKNNNCNYFAKKTENFNDLSGIKLVTVTSHPETVCLAPYLCLGVSTLTFWTAKNKISNLEVHPCQKVTHKRL